MHSLIVFAVLILFSSTAFDVIAKQRPKVGLVLSGGGAKGAAHIGVLKVLEQHNVPIDYVVGTSIGAYVAGLYALGYTPSEIEKIMLGLPWENSFTDSVPRQSLPFREQALRDKYNIVLRLGYSDKTFKAPTGLLLGQNSTQLLRLSTDVIAEFSSFDQLAIPYRAVATDLSTAKAVVLDSGSITEAMSASAAVPSIVEPVVINGKMLVDGGISNNMPVDVIRKMGADRIIAVDIGSPLADQDHIKDTVDVLNQLSTILTNNTTLQQVAQLRDNDLYIRPKIDGLSTTDFSIMPQALTLGEEAARAEQEEEIKKQKRAAKKRQMEEEKQRQIEEDEQQRAEQEEAERQAREQEAEMARQRKARKKQKREEPEPEQEQNIIEDGQDDEEDNNMIMGDDDNDVGGGIDINEVDPESKFGGQAMAQLRAQEEEDEANRAANDDGGASGIKMGKIGRRGKKKVNAVERSEPQKKNLMSDAPKRTFGGYSEDAVSGGTNDTRTVIGQPVGTNFLVRFSHVDQETGEPVYLDINGEETRTWDPKDRVAVGKVLPDAIGGITNTFRYKGFDLNFLFVYSIGGNIYDSSSKRQLGVVDEWNKTTQIFDRWQEAGDEATYAKLTLDAANLGSTTPWINTDLWLHDASYARLRNLTIGYTLSRQMVERMKLSSCRISFTGSNLLTFTNYPGIDPEIARDFENPTDRNMSPNISYLTPPQEKTFTFTVNLTF